jgi:hypothetical protein
MTKAELLEVLAQVPDGDLEICFALVPAHMDASTPAGLQQSTSLTCRCVALMHDKGNPSSIAFGFFLQHDHNGTKYEENLNPKGAH